MGSTKITLKVLPFKNPSGAIAYRVSGTILGTRVQKNFPTRDEAEGFMNGLVRTAIQADSAKRERLTSTTFQTDEPLRQQRRGDFGRQGPPLADSLGGYSAAPAAVVEKAPSSSGT
jgi:hypothetical protein